MKWLAVLAVLLFTSGAASGAGIPSPLKQNTLTTDQFQARQINALKDSVRALQLDIRCIAENATWIEVKTIDDQPYVVPTDETDPNGVEIPVIQQASACTGS